MKLSEKMTCKTLTSKFKLFISTYETICDSITPSSINIINKNTNETIKLDSKLESLIDEAYKKWEELTKLLIAEKDDIINEAEKIITHIRNNKSQHLQKKTNILIETLKKSIPDLFTKKYSRRLFTNRQLNALLEFIIYLSSLELINWPFNEIATANIIAAFSNTSLNTYTSQNQQILRRLKSNGINLSNLQPEKLIRYYHKGYYLAIRNPTSFFYFLKRNRSFLNTFYNYLKCICISKSPNELQIIQKELLPVLKLALDYTQITENNNFTQDTKINNFLKKIIISKIELFQKEILRRTRKNEYIFWTSVLNTSVKTIKNLLLNNSGSNSTIEDTKKLITTFETQEIKEGLNETKKLITLLAENINRDSILSQNIQKTLENTYTNITQKSMNLKLIKIIKDDFLKEVEQSQANDLDIHSLDSLVLSCSYTFHAQNVWLSIEDKTSTDCIKEILSMTHDLLTEVSNDEHLNEPENLLSRIRYLVEDLFINKKLTYKNTLYKIKQKTFSKNPEKLITDIILPDLKQHKVDPNTYNHEKFIYLLIISNQILNTKPEKVQNLFKFFTRKHLGSIYSAIVNNEMVPTSKKEPTIKILLGLYILFTILRKIKAVDGPLTFNSIEFTNDSIHIDFYRQSKKISYGILIATLLWLLGNKKIKDYIKNILSTTIFTSQELSIPLDILQEIDIKV